MRMFPPMAMAIPIEVYSDPSSSNAIAGLFQEGVQKGQDKNKAKNSPKKNISYHWPYIPFATISIDE